MNVRPKNYTWPEFYDHVVDLFPHAFSWPMIAKRVMLNRGWIPKWFNFIRSVSSEGFGRIKYHTKIRGLLDTNVSVRNFLEGNTSELPKFYARKIRGKLGSLYDLLPEGATMHDHHAYIELLSGTESSSCRIEPTPQGRKRGHIRTKPDCIFAFLSLSVSDQHSGRGVNPGFSA